MNSLVSVILFPVAAYLLGAVPFGLIVVRLVSKTDIRRIGSGNIGATNVRRAAGTGWAVVVLAGDILKGLLPTLAAVWMTTDAFPWLPALTALAAVCGHMYPLYLGFKPSGKGVATALGSLLIPAPWACLCAVLVFLGAVRLSRRVSVGSLTGIMFLPPAAWLTTGDPYTTTAAVIIMVLILIRHKENLYRLANGKEPALGERGTVSESND